MNTPLASIPTTPRTVQIVFLFGVLLVIGVSMSIRSWRAGQPIALPDAAHEKIECASYTPSHDGHTLTVAEKRALVASDLVILAQRFRCVRTYSVSPGLDDVPKVARALGLKVMLGMWISSHGPSNDQEIARGIALANEYTDVVTSVIVGNEVLLRREQTPAQLRALIERVRAGTQVPVTYADVWEFWLRNADLAQVASFVTVHILPYWEDHPIGIEHALDHVQSIYRKVQAAFPDKRVVIGETGWPSAGRPRLEATPSLVNEARFIREFVAYAEREKIPYNIIEAFDQPWKRVQEGTVGGHWGLYDAAGAEKFAFTGPIVARATWRIELLATASGIVLFVLLGLARKPRLDTRALALFGVAGAVAGSVLCAQWQYMGTANRTWLDWTATAVWATSGSLTYIVVMFALARWLSGAAYPQCAASIANVVRSWGHKSHVTTDTNRLLGVLRFLVLLGAAYVCLALVYDGRGRDFPIALLALPTLAFALVECVTPTRAEALLESEEQLLAWCVGLAPLYIAWHETFANSRAIAWCGLCVLLAVTLLIGHWRARLLIKRRATHPHQSAEQQSHAAQLKRV